MTEQVPNVLINECKRVKLSGLRLERISRGDMSANAGMGEAYEFENPPDVPHDNAFDWNCYRGYVATFRLRTDGTLYLVRYTYWPGGKERAVAVNERLLGDFWMVMTREWFGPTTCVPFRGGEVVVDRRLWRVDEGV